MEQDQEKMRVCKFCNKKFLNGKVLGGHMRIHVASNSAQEEINLENCNMDFEGYGLRENPKKSWKFSGFNNGGSSSIQESMKCNVCGKEFHSPRSLHGHMRHHSGKDRRGVHCKECGKRFRSLRSLSGHMRLHSEKFTVSTEAKTVMTLSDAETVNLVRRKRSNRMRYKATPNSSFSSLNESVSGFEIEQEEVEEVAMCLMMLSRGIREFDEFISVDVPLDNTSLVFEDTLMSQSKRAKRIEGDDDDLFFEGDELVCGLESECGGFECEMESTGEKMVELGVPISSFYKAVSTERPKMDDESVFALSDSVMEKVSNKEVKRENAEKESNDSEFVKSTPSSEAMFDASAVELEKDSDKPMMTYYPSDSGLVKDSWKKNEFKCRMCNKTFATYQALGGHQTFHRMPRSCIAAKNENCQKDNLPETEAAIKSARLKHTEDSVEQEIYGVNVIDCESGKSKEYKCLVCFKTFVSGQALGGHKRAHLAKSREEQAIAIGQDSPNICDASVVTLPDEEANHGGGFRSWWAESGYKHELMVGLVAN